MITAHELTLHSITPKEIVADLESAMLNAAKRGRRSITIGSQLDNDYSKDLSIWSSGLDSPLWRKCKDYLESLGYEVNYRPDTEVTLISWN